jgi:beta-phosphoglucomutase-like phosphatase (HAD superfamily)
VKDVLLLDADGNLFPSEAPAFVASAEVTNRFLASLGVRRTYTAEELLATSTGKSFRTTATELAAAHGVAVESPDALDDWVAEEKKVVSDYLGRVLEPDPAVLEPLRRLAGHFRLAAVSSSALSRLEACFRATGLTALIPAGRRFSAEDSLPVPTSKPDPAIYRYAAERHAAPIAGCLAVEDSVPGVRSAAGAGIDTIGNLTFVPVAERDERRRELIAAGATGTVGSWTELADRLLPRGP